MLMELWGLVTGYLHTQTDTQTCLKSTLSHVYSTSDSLLFSCYTIYVRWDLFIAGCEHSVCNNQHSSTTMQVWKRGHYAIHQFKKLFSSD